MKEVFSAAFENSEIQSEGSIFFKLRNPSLFKICVDCIVFSQTGQKSISDEVFFNNM